MICLNYKNDINISGGCVCIKITTVGLPYREIAQMALLCELRKENNTYIHYEGLLAAYWAETSNKTKQTLAAISSQGSLMQTFTKEFLC